MQKKVLIADNDQLLRALLREGLESTGYQVSEAADGLEAWQEIQDESPDYLVLDLVMPKLDGARLCGYLRSDPRFRSLPIFVLTGAAPEAARELEALGAEAYIAKRSANETIEDLLRAFQAFERGERPALTERIRGLDEYHPRQIVIELLAETAHLTAVLQNLGEGILLLDLAGRILYANPAGVEIFQRSELELLGAGFVTLVRGQAGDSLRQALQGLASQGGGATMRLDASYHDRTLHLTVTNLLERGRVVGHLLLIRDVTPYFQRIQELRTLNELAALFTSTLHLDEVLQRVMEQIQTYMRAEAGSLLLKDPEADTLVFRIAVGEHKKAVEGRRLKVGEGIAGWVFREGVPAIVPDAQQDPRFWSGMDAATGFMTRSMLCVPLSARNKVIGVIQVMNSLSSRSFTEEDLKLLCAIASQAAVAIENARLHEAIRQHAATLEVRVQERTRELEAMNEQLQEASRHKSEFLANMSHELRTPLNSIIGFSELMLGQDFGPLTDPQARHLGHIHESGKHLLQLINDILDLSKVEAGKLVLRPEALPVAETLEDILVIARGLANKKAQDIQADVAPDLPPLTADPLRFKQILFNLLSNALKFTAEQGRITLTARRVHWSTGQIVDLSGPIDQLTTRPTDSARDWLEVAVTDSGVGIKAEDLPRLFQEFVQLDASISERHEGTGLGLALTKRLVELHGGSIWAASKGEGLGSTFTVLLPFGGPGGPSGASAGPASP